MDWSTLLRESLWLSVAFSAVMTVLIMGAVRWNREMWLSDYPPDVQAKWGPISAKAKRERNIFAALFFGVIIAAMVVVPIRLTEALGHSPNFFEMFVCVGIMFFIFNLVDAFIIDWLLLVKLFPTIIILPGTEGMAGYDEMNLGSRLWTINLFKGMPISLAMGLISAGLTSLVMWVGSLI